MRSPWALLSSLLVLTAAVALAACGGKDDEVAIRDAIRGSLTSTDPDDCGAGERTTAAFRRQYAFGSAALARLYETQCRAEPKRLAATSVEVSGVKVDGDRAQASFSATGGQYVFDSAAVRLRKDDDRWQLDQLTAVKLKRDRYDAQQLTLAADAQLAFTQEAAACFTRRLARVSDAALERAIVMSDPAVFADPLLICIVRPGLRKVGLSNRHTRCAILRLRRDAGELTQTALMGTEASKGALQDLVVGAAAACAD